MEEFITVKMVLKVYGTPTCYKCKNLIAQLDENKIEYIYIDVTKDRDALNYLREQGVSSFPYTEEN